jgi:hypothetical protein
VLATRYGAYIAELVLHAGRLTWHVVSLHRACNNTVCLRSALLAMSVDQFIKTCLADWIWCVAGALVVLMFV